jgi:outer membrane protein assembly factor BamB
MTQLMPKLYFKPVLIVFLFLFTGTTYARYYDWPMWRYNYERSASTPEQLADQLYLQWEVKYSPRIPVWDDPLNQNLMQYDRIFEPIVAGNRLFIGFNDKDKVLALDLSSGKELWHHFADGPVRLPMAAANGKLYFTSDDGYCYCLSQEDGSVIWKLLLAPAENKLLGNKRLISMWPARGGIVIKDNVIYTAASIFPLMGTFIYAINADDGSIIWKNDGTGSNYILQPHNSPAFADVAPQGTFAISGKILLVAGGRTVPAAFDLETGKEIYYKLAASGKTGGGFTCSNEKVFFNHYRERMTYMYDSRSGNKILSDAGEYPVIAGDTIIFSGKNIRAAILGPDNKPDSLWTIEIPATNDLVKAGNHLYAADSTGINVLRLNGGNKPYLIRKYFSGKVIDRLVVSNGKLIAVSNDGTIQVFGDKPVKKIISRAEIATPPNGRFIRAQRIISSTGITEGYALLFGTKDLRLIKGLLANTSLSIIAYDRNPKRIASLRNYFDKKGISAKRISFFTYKTDYPLLPRYFSSLTIINDIKILNDFDKDILTGIYESTRPYGGKIVVRTGTGKQNRLDRTLDSLNLYGAEMLAGKRMALVTRSGPLNGTDNWNHNYGDVANTLKSDDNTVKAPLGILWFGGNSNLDVLPRHGHGPGEQVIDGRLIIEGLSSISARDVYTGRVLWKREFPNLMDDSWMVYYDETYDGENPLDTKYNQVHLPGSNARGTNFIATPEYVYLLEGDKCHLIDIKTGELKKTFTTGVALTNELAYIGVYEDLLILGNNFMEYPEMDHDSITLKDPKFTNFGLSASQELVILNRFSGEKLWSLPAKNGFIHNSVIAGDGILFCLDKLPQYLETKLKRRGETIPEDSRLLYIDIRTGKIIHEETADVFGTWLGYSSEHHLLLQATRPSSDMLHGEDDSLQYHIKRKGMG